jgi:cytochrome P450
MTTSAGNPEASRVPPGPWSWPLVGNVPDIRAAGGILEYKDRLWRKYGDTYRIKLFRTNAIVVVHPNALKQVLSARRERYAKGKIYDSAREVLGNGLVTLDGDPWKARRALAQTAFHRQSLAKLTDAMTRAGARFLDDLMVRAASGPLEIDAHRAMVKLTLDVVITALLGDDLLRGADVPYETLSTALECMSERNGIVLPSWIPTPQNVKFRRTVRELDTLMYSLIGRSRQRGREDGSLLAMLLAAVDADTGKPLPDRDVRDEVTTLFVAGHETTALTLTWVFAFLHDRPEVLERMRREVDEVLHGRDPGFDDVPRLGYIRQVVEETLRLRPAAPSIPRNVIEEDEIDGYRVKPGDVVLLYFWATHRHREFWPDPEFFDPDRFSVARSKERNSWSYLPFSGGPRTCIGNMFALVEASILVAQLLNRFDVEVLPCADVKPVALATMRPSRSVRIVLRRRPQFNAKRSGEGSAGGHRVGDRGAA